MAKRPKFSPIVHRIANITPNGDGSVTLDLIKVDADGAFVWLQRSQNLPMADAQSLGTDFIVAKDD